MTQPSKSLAEMRAESAAKASIDLWACPRCGCKGPHPVANTYDTAEGRRRRRVCRNCGQGLVVTTERPDPPAGFKLAIVPEDEERAVA